jgi:hypothetical protein
VAFLDFRLRGNDNQYQTEMTSGMPAKAGMRFPKSFLGFHQN